MNLAPVLSFIGSLFPIIFPKNEFKPKRAVAVFVLVFAMMFAIDHFGEDTVENAIDKTGDLIELTEESR